MPQKPPRLLVADDDLGVIAAYRIVLEDQPHGRAVQRMFGLEQLEQELFGSSSSDTDSGLPWRVHFVDQGEDAVAAVLSAKEDGDPYTAAFLDIRMPPGIDGCETARQIRSIDPTIHFVFVSGYSDYDDEELVAAGGGHDQTTVLPKPVWPDQLREVASKVTRRQKSAGARAGYWPASE